MTHPHPRTGTSTRTTPDLNLPRLAAAALAALAVAGSGAHAQTTRVPAGTLKILAAPVLQKLGLIEAPCPDALRYNRSFESYCARFDGGIARLKVAWDIVTRGLLDAGGREWRYTSSTGRYVLSYRLEAGHAWQEELMVSYRPSTGELVLAMRAPVPRRP